MEANKIIHEAEKWIGTPFHHQGRTIGVGVDCAGLIIGVARDLNIFNCTFTGYGRQPYLGLLEKEMEKYLIKTSSLEPGCIILMKFKTEPQHLCFYAGNDQIIHAYESVKKCIKHRLDHRWKKRIVSFWKFP